VRQHTCAVLATLLQNICLCAHFILVPRPVFSGCFFGMSFDPVSFHFDIVLRSAVYRSAEANICPSLIRHMQAMLVHTLCRYELLDDLRDMASVLLF
jgi:hypothetical protein